jgi:hypothetical protein
VDDEIMIERLEAANDRYWSSHSMGGTVYGDPDEEREIHLALFGGKWK